MFTAVVTDPIDIHKVTEQFLATGTNAGALVTFVGFVRDFNDQGDIQGLELEHYPGMTEKALNQLAQQTCERFDCLSVGIVHRVGKIDNHQPIVWVGALSLHRKAAFNAAAYAMDILKKDVPLWKKEWRDGAPQWVNAKATDALAAERWDTDGQQ